MDPILVEALRNIRTAQHNASAAGVVLAPADLDAFVREETGGKYGLADAQRLAAGIDSDISLRNLGRSAVQGALFSFGDELLGLLPEAIGGGEAAKEEMRLREDLFKQEHPYADAAAGLAGGLLLPGGIGAKAATGGLELARAVKTGATIGALSGALSGAGAGEGLGDRASRAVNGAIAGGLFGAAVPAGTHAAQFFRPAARAERRLQRAFNESGGADALRRRASEFQTGGRGDEVMAADLSPQLRRELDFAANNNESVHADLAPRLAQRQAGMTDRMLRDTRELIDVPTNASRHVRELRGQRKAFADPAYEELRQQNADLPITDEMARQLQKPVAQRALDRAHANGLMAEPPDVGTLSMNHVLDVRKALRSARDRAYREGDGTLGGALRDTQQAIEGELEQAVPGWRGVNDEYRRYSTLIDRVLEGRKQWTQDDSRELTSLVRGMPTEELDALRTGLASRLVSRLRSVQTNRDEAKRIIDAGPAMQDKLKIIFGDQRRFNEFMRRARLEMEMSRARRAIGGSATHRRGAATVDPLDIGIAAATAGPAGVAAQVPGILSRMVPAAVTRRTAGELAPWLMTHGASNIDDMIRRFSARPARVGSTSVGRVPAAAGSLFDQL